MFPIERRQLRPFLRAATVMVATLAATASVVAQTAPTDPYNYSRSASFTYDPVTGLMLSETAEPDNPSLCVTTTYGYGEANGQTYGNRTSSTVSNCSGSPAQALFVSRRSTASFAPAAQIAVNVAGTNVPLPQGLLPVAATNALSQTTQLRYDPRFGASTSATDANGLTTSSSLDDFGRKLLETHAEGTKTAYYYCTVTGLGLDASADTPNCPVPNAGEVPADAVEFLHTEPRDINNNKMGSFTRIYLDRLGRELRVVTEAFDGSSQPAAAGSLIARDTAYNAWGAKILETQPYFLATRSSNANGSNDAGAKLTTVDVLGRQVTVDVADANGSRGSVTFGALGIRRASRTTIQYDGLSTTTTNDKGKSRVVEANVLGQVLRVTDALGAQLAHQHDAFGNLTGTRDALQNSITLQYDIRGHKLQLNDPDAGLITYCYDALGQLKAQQNASMRAGGSPACPASTGTGTTAVAQQGWTTLAYDQIGRMTQRIEPEYTTTWTYDAYANSVSCTMGVGRLCELNTSSGVSRKYVYDSAGRPSSTRTNISNGPSFAATLAYEGNTGRLSAQTYPTGLQVNYGYTLRGYLRTLALGTGVTINPLPSAPGGTPGPSASLSSGSMLWQALVINALGRSEQQSLGNGVISRAQYEPYKGRPSQLSAGASTSTNVLSESYQWDSVDNLTSRADNIGDGSSGAVTDSFAYDELNRLTQYTVAAPAIPNLSRQVTLQYNALGNLLSKSDLGMYSYNASGPGSVTPHAVRVLNGSSTTNYNYDANGNLRSANGGPYQALSYTSFNLPDSNSGIAGPGGSLRYTWSYDENHARIKEVHSQSSGTMAGTRTTWYLHPDNTGGLSFESEINAPNSPSTANPAVISNRHYLSVGGQAIGVLVSTGSLPELAPAATAPPAIASLALVKVEYWHKDQLGSLKATTDHAGAVTSRYAYDPFGQRRVASGQYDAFGTLIVDWSPAVNRGTDRGFTGHEHLDDIGLIHMNGRIYDPRMGRVLQADPLIQDPDNLQSTNRYSYVMNNPLNATDPSGFASECGANGYQAVSGASANFECNAVARRSIKKADGSTDMEKPVDTKHRPGDAASKELPDRNAAGAPEHRAAKGTPEQQFLARAHEAWLGGGCMSPTNACASERRGLREFYSSYLERTQALQNFDAEIAATIVPVGRLLQLAKGAAPVVEMAAAKGITYNGITGPGPLGAKVASTFRSGTYTELTTSEATTLYRVWGGRAGELGPYWTRTTPSGPVQSVLDSALNPAWGNAATNVTRIQVPAGVKIFEGVAAPQGGLVGGGSQVFIPKVDPAWIVK